MSLKEEYDDLVEKVSTLKNKEKKFEALHRIVKLCKENTIPVGRTILVEHKEFYYDMKNKLHQELKEIKDKIALGNLNKCSVKRIYHNRKKYIENLLGYRNSKENNRVRDKDVVGFDDELSNELSNNKYSYGAYKITPYQNVKFYGGGGCSGR